MKSLITPLLVGLLAGLSGCGTEAPPVDPPPASFAEYYSGELFLLEKAKLQGAGDSLAGARLDSLRRRFHITARERDSLLAWCQASLPRWEAFLGEVLTRLEEREKAARGSGGPEADRAGGEPGVSKVPAGKPGGSAPAGRR